MTLRNYERTPAGEWVPIPSDDSSFLSDLLADRWPSTLPRPPVEPDWDRIPKELQDTPSWVLSTGSEDLDGQRTETGPETGERRPIPPDGPTRHPFDVITRAMEGLPNLKGFSNLKPPLHFFLMGTPFTAITLAARNPETGELSELGELVMHTLDTYGQISQWGDVVTFVLRGVSRFGNLDVGGTMVSGANVIIHPTGVRLPGTPTTINDRQEQLDSLCGFLLARAGREAPQSDEDLSAR